MRDDGPVVVARGARLPFGVWPDGATLDLAVEPGEHVALLGGSATGKSLTLRCLAGVLTPAPGEVEVLGQDPRGAARQIGACLAVAPSLSGTPRKRLASALSAARVPTAQRQARLAEALDALGLVDVRDRTVGELCGSEQVALEIACALVHRPRLLLLDDVRTRLDEARQERLEAYLSDRRWDGGLVVVEATRDAGLAAAAGRVVLLGRGGPLATGAPQDLLASVGAQVVTIECEQPRALQRTLTGIYDVQVLERAGQLRFSAPDGIAVAAHVFRHPAGGMRVVHVREPDLWDVVSRLEAGRDL